ncbi:MAG: hypothetical protein K2M82_07800 [Lachnospiraceae bacterium]|nr:hypothetical protein [Lachnospiraceae bacterium]
MLQTNGTCPYCGAEVKDYRQYGWEYGSPIRKCEKCGNDYLNKTYHEIAVEGIDPDTLNVKKSVSGMLVGLAIMIGAIVLTLVLTWATVSIANRYYIQIIGIGAVLTVIGFLFAACMLVDVLKIKTGAKERKLNSLREESAQRLQNKEYAKALADLGYSIPEEYLERV